MTNTVRERNLRLAQQRKREHARLLAEIRGAHFATGAQLVAAALEAPDEHGAALRVGWLLGAIERVGPHTTRGLLRSVTVADPRRRVGELTDRQRRVLADRVRDWAARRAQRTRVPAPHRGRAA